MRASILILISLFAVAGCDDKKTADTNATPSAPVPPTPPPVSAAPSAQPSASASSAPTDSKPLFGCKTKVGDVPVNVQVFAAAKSAPIAVMKLDMKPAARSFTATTLTHAATNILTFSGYGEGDTHPASEPSLVAGTTVLGHLVVDGAKMNFFADKGFPTHPAKDGPYLCDTK